MNFSDNILPFLWNFIIDHFLMFVLLVIFIVGALVVWFFHERLPRNIQSEIYPIRILVTFFLIVMIGFNGFYLLNEWPKPLDIHTEIYNSP